MTPLEVLLGILGSSFVLVYLLVLFASRTLLAILAANYMNRFEQIDDTFTALVDKWFGKPWAHALVIALASSGLMCFYFGAEIIVRVPQ